MRSAITERQLRERIELEIREFLRQPHISIPEKEKDNISKNLSSKHIGSACNEMGIFFDRAGKQEQSFAWFLKGANLGNKPSMWGLAWAYHIGLGCKRNLEQAAYQYFACYSHWATEENSETHFKEVLDRLIEIATLPLTAENQAGIRAAQRAIISIPLKWNVLVKRLQTLKQSDDPQAQQEFRNSLAILTHAFISVNGHALNDAQTDELEIALTDLHSTHLDLSSIHWFQFLTSKPSNTEFGFLKLKEQAARWKPAQQESKSDNVARAAHLAWNQTLAAYWQSPLIPYDIFSHAREASLAWRPDLAEFFTHFPAFIQRAGSTFSTYQKATDLCFSPGRGNADIQTGIQLFAESARTLLNNPQAQLYAMHCYICAGDGAFKTNDLLATTQHYESAIDCAQKFKLDTTPGLLALRTIAQPVFEDKNEPAKVRLFMIFAKCIERETNEKTLAILHAMLPSVVKYCSAILTQISQQQDISAQLQFLPVILKMLPRININYAPTLETPIVEMFAAAVPDEKGGVTSRKTTLFVKPLIETVKGWLKSSVPVSSDALRAICTTILSWPMKDKELLQLMGSHFKFKAEEPQIAQKCFQQLLQLKNTTLDEQELWLRQLHQDDTSKKQLAEIASLKKSIQKPLALIDIVKSATERKAIVVSTHPETTRSWRYEISFPLDRLDLADEATTEPDSPKATVPVEIKSEEGRWKSDPVSQQIYKSAVDAWIETLGSAEDFAKLDYQKRRQLFDELAHELHFYKNPAAQHAIQALRKRWDRSSSMLVEFLKNEFNCDERGHLTGAEFDTNSADQIQQCNRLLLKIRGATSDDISRIEKISGKSFAKFKKDIQESLEAMLSTVDEAQRNIIFAIADRERIYDHIQSKDPHKIELSKNAWEDKFLALEYQLSRFINDGNQHAMISFSIKILALTQHVQRVMEETQLPEANILILREKALKLLSEWANQHHLKPGTEAHSLHELALFGLNLCNNKSMPVLIADTTLHTDTIIMSALEHQKNDTLLPLYLRGIKSAYLLPHADEDRFKFVGEKLAAAEQKEKNKTLAPTTKQYSPRLLSHVAVVTTLEHQPKQLNPTHKCS
jgi:hypothetical protein